MREPGAKDRELIDLAVKVLRVLDVHGMGHEDAVEMVRAGCERATQTCNNCRHYEDKLCRAHGRDTLYLSKDFYCYFWEPKPDDGREGE